MPLFQSDVLAIAFTRGTGTLSATGGTVTITDAAAKTTSMILLTDTKANITNMGSATITTKSNGSFVVQSTNVLDSSTFDYVILN